MEANVILIKCGQAKKTFGVRIQKMKDGDWARTWAFRINDTQAQSEGYDKNQIQGSLYATEEYPGCPYCKTDYFVQCSHCNKISCYSGGEIATCAWCGRTLSVSAAESFTIDSDKF